MAQRVTHYYRQGFGCPECGEHRMHKLIGLIVKAEPTDGTRRYKSIYRCLTCRNEYEPPPVSELPPIAQQPLRNLIKGVLYYADKASGTSVDMARGAVTGVVTTLMEERAISLEKALALVKDALPRNYRSEAIFPKAWLEAMEEVP